MTSRVHVQIIRSLAVVVVAAVFATVPAAALAVAHGTPVTGSTARWEATLVLKGKSPLNKGEDCSGSLIRPNVMLAAGHCAAYADPGELPADDEVLVGNQPLTSGRDQVIPIRATRVDPAFATTPNPLFPGDLSEAGVSGDMSLIVLAHAARGVTPLKLGNWPAVGTPVTLYGHGVIGAGLQSDALRAGSFQIGLESQCQQQVPATFGASTMGCAQGRAQACGGDSGGPLVVGHGSSAEVVGVLSSGMDVAGKYCGYPGPSFFARVQAGRPWINRELEQFASSTP
jgi:hypothetical protein